MCREMRSNVRNVSQFFLLSVEEGMRTQMTMDTSNRNKHLRHMCVTTVRGIEDSKNSFYLLLLLSNADGHLLKWNLCWTISSRDEPFQCVLWERKHVIKFQIKRTLI